MLNIYLLIKISKFEYSSAGDSFFSNYIKKAINIFIIKNIKAIIKYLSLITFCFWSIICEKKLRIAWIFRILSFLFLQTKFWLKNYVLVECK